MVTLTRSKLPGRMGVRSHHWAEGTEARLRLARLAQRLSSVLGDHEAYEALQVAGDYFGCRSRLPRPVALWIPAGAVFSILDVVANAAGLVQVEWDGKRIQRDFADYDSGARTRVRRAPGHRILRHAVGAATGGKISLAHSVGAACQLIRREDSAAVEIRSDAISSLA